MLAIGGIVVVAAAVIAILLSQRSGTPGSTSSTLPPASAASGASAAIGARLPDFVATANDPAIGKPIPEVTGTDFAGKAISIKADGRPKLLLFVAHWCPHCQREVPVVQAWLNAGRLPAGVDLISIATSIDPNRPNYPPDTWLQREGWTPPVLVDSDNSVLTRYGLTGFPFWVVVDAKGAVVERLTGELTTDQLDALVAAATA
jgi:thiol-disulfide isomerase/thioredoxin